MSVQVDIASLIDRGGVYTDIEGSSPEEIYREISQMISLPEGISAASVYDALCERERIMSTAVGNGIALPHARCPILKSKDDEEICVVYLKTPIDMHAPDELRVSIMFVLLTYDAQSHLEMLSALATLVRKDDFRKLLANHADKNTLLNAAKKVQSKKVQR
ncbi:MAG: PTS sugar transporter subunit IIA [Treponema sp.]|nr:PTS sugar transporter subunit IIA [Treponema sp.]